MLRDLELIRDLPYSVTEVFVQLTAAIGVGCLFVTPMLAIQSAMPLKDMAVATATLGLMR